MKLIDDIGLSHLIEKLKALIGLKADKTYVDNKVKTDVPVGAKFTDTIYTHPASHPASMVTESSTKRFVSDSEKSTWSSKSDTDTITTINGKTGAISKADIVALGIPAQDTVYTHPTTHSISEVSGLQTALDGKVDDSQVLTNVPLNAKFTDTVYSHPSSHPASMITESSTKRFVSDSEKSTWNGKQNALGYTPVNKAGDNITGQLGVESTTFPVIDIARNTSSTGTGLYGGARLQRKTTNPTNGVGIGFYFQAPNSNKAMTHAGMFGGALGTINAGSEKGEIVLSPSYAGQDPYTRRDFIVRAISASKAEAELNGKLRTEQTLASDPTNTVATKKYVDDNKTVEYTHPTTHPANMITGLPTSLPANGGNADTVGGFTVGVNVPANAEFTDTDTITTINGKTGVIAKADIVALGIPAQDTNTTYTAGTNIAITGNTISATDTVVDVSGKADKTYIDNKVKTDVPTGAKFTDTVIDIADNLTTDDATKALSATQGKILDEKSPNKEFYVPHDTKTNHATGNAEGEQTTASGEGSHAEGTYTTASEYASHAEGVGTTASGHASHAEGTYTTASEYASHAEGIGAIASGDASHAEGGFTTASGSCSHAQNEGTIAQGGGQTAIGHFNIPQGTTFSHLPDDHAFIIGNGSNYDNRSNALTVNWQGDVDIAGDYKIAGEALYSKAEIDNKVKTDVPAGAKFTDTNTVTSINGKTGTILKADIVALGIPAQDTNTTYTAGTNIAITGNTISATDTVVDISGKADKTYVDNKVKTDVPENAKFTDTNTVTSINGKTGVIEKADIVALGIPAQDTNTTYTAGTNIAITGNTISATDTVVDVSGKADKTYVDNKVKTDVPENAKFTDTNTITSINGTTGIIAKADITALGIPAQDTVYTHPTGTNPHGTTKSDVGLGNVTNDKQMPISGGVLENYREKLVTLSGTSTAINLSLGNVFTHTLTGNTTYSITNAVNGQAHSFTLIVNMGSTVRTLTFPASVKWQGGEIPDLTTASKTYILTFMTINGGTTWLGMFGGEF